MGDQLAFLAWSPEIGMGGYSDVSFLMIALLSLIGAGLVNRLANINSVFNFSINYGVMLVACLLVNSFAAKTLLPVSNELIASALTANVGMTIAGFVLLFGYSKSS